jgi:hypothetical protein
LGEFQDERIAAKESGKRKQGLRVRERKRRREGEGVEEERRMRQECRSRDREGEGENESDQDAYTQLSVNCHTPCPHQVSLPAYAASEAPGSKFSYTPTVH